MAAAENLFETTRSFLTPDSVRKFSIALDEPSEKVEAGLQSVVPTLLNGIINESSTEEGAQKIVNLMEAENLDGSIPNNLNDKSYLSRGENVVEDIFGKNYHSIASSLIPSTGMDKKNVEKLMEMAAPAVLGVIGSKIKNDLNPETLNDFLLGQMKFEDKKKPPFGLVVAGFIILVIGMFWVIGRKNIPVSNLKRDISSIEKSNIPASVAASRNGLTVQDLSTFMATATLDDLPKRFTVQNLSFFSGSTDMKPGGDKDIEVMVNSLKRYPKVTASIEAYIEDTGDEDENLLLSENRAMLVREELIGRGIEPSRVRAEGRGPKTGGQLYFIIKNIR